MVPGVTENASSATRWITMIARPRQDTGLV